MAKPMRIYPVFLRQLCGCPKKFVSEPPIQWILRLDDDFDAWLDSLPEDERERIKTVLRGIERSFAMPWDYIEADASVTQNIDDIEALHELHLRCQYRDLVIVFTVVKETFCSWTTVHCESLGSGLYWSQVRNVFLRCSRHWKQSSTRRLVMFKTLTESIAKERPEVHARIIANGDKLAAKRDAAVRSATGEQRVLAPKAKAVAHA